MKYFTHIIFITFVFVAPVNCRAQTPAIVPDTSFGVNGVVFNPYNASFSKTAAAIDVQADGKIVEAIAGTAYAAVRRYLGNGILDTTFGTGGYAVFDTFGNYHYGGVNVKVLANGNILVCAAGGSNAFLTRLTPAGTTDYTFGTSGYTSFGLLANMDMKVLSDGSIRVVNTYQNQNNNIDTAVIYKTSADGIIDNTFGNNGAFNVPQSFWRTCSFALDHNDGIIVSARSPAGVTVTRVLPAGSIDNSFGTNGFTNLNDSTVSNTLILNNTIPAVLPDNSIVVVLEYAAQAVNYYNYAAHLSPAGVQDMSYGTNGFSNALSGQAEVVAAPVFDNGDLLLVGQASPGSDYGELALLNTTGHDDSIFSGSPIYTFQYDTTNGGNNYTNVGPTIILSGNKIIQAGGYQNLFTYISEYDYSGIVNGIKNINVGSDFSLYPNPSSEKCNIKVADNASKKYTAQLFDIAGQNVGPEWMFYGQNTFSVQQYSKGIYLLKITDSNGAQTTKKLMVQ